MTANLLKKLPRKTTLYNIRTIVGEYQDLLKTNKISVDILLAHLREQEIFGDEFLEIIPYSPNYTIDRHFPIENHRSSGRAIIVSCNYYDNKYIVFFREQDRRYRHWLKQNRLSEERTTEIIQLCNEITKKSFELDQLRRETQDRINQIALDIG